MGSGVATFRAGLWRLRVQLSPSFVPPRPLSSVAPLARVAGTGMGDRPLSATWQRGRRRQNHDVPRRSWRRCPRESPVWWQFWAELDLTVPLRTASTEECAWEARRWVDWTPCSPHFNHYLRIAPCWGRSAAWWVTSLKTHYRKDLCHNQTTYTHTHTERETIK